MLKNFQQYCTAQTFWGKGDKVLLAVSGGVDSMVMLDLFIQSGVDIGIAHCNFQLRGADSFGDEAFVKLIAQRAKTPLHLIRFDTSEYAQNEGLSIQMAARRLRYDWFETIRTEYNYNFVATAHHSDDVLEGFFVNLLRKTGISGLNGIRLKLGCLIRPMLFTSKEKILQYAENQNIIFREDRTNQDDYYQRNYIRHHVIPAFKRLKSNFADSMLETIRIISNQEAIYKAHIRQIAEALIRNTSQGMELAIDEIKKLAYPETYLFEILYPFHFNESQIDDILKSMDDKREKKFFSASHQLLKTRNTLIIRSFDDIPFGAFVIENSDYDSFCRCGIETKIISYNKDFIFENQSNIAYFDFDKLKFPLKLRAWEHGDFFYPLGGMGKRKISDLFTDTKLSSLEKKKNILLCNGNQDIVWVMGIRGDNRYKVTSKTKNILICKL